jgi:hypothetical protein
MEINIVFHLPPEILLTGGLSSLSLEKAGGKTIALPPLVSRQESTVFTAIYQK